MEAREDSSPPREDEDVESERHHTCRRRRTHSISAGVGPQRSCVAREPRTAHFCPRVQSFGVPIGHRVFVEEFLARKTREHELLFKRILAMEDLQSAWLVLLLRSPTCNFLVEVRSPRVGPAVCSQSRRQHVGMSRKVDWSARSVRAFRGDGVSTVLARGSGVDQCDEGLQSCALGKLDRFPRHDPEEAPRSGTSLMTQSQVNRIDEELRVRMDLPTWEEFAKGTQPQVGEEGQEPTLPRHGWQKRAHKCLEDKWR